MRVKGAANVRESNRSSMPPCPLRKLLVSLIFASRFNKDSVKSPNCPKMPVMSPRTNASMCDT